MFDRCISCHRPLGANRTLERFRIGRRVAFDPGRGRLWAVCPACRRWNLAPIEERWEALEELERLTHGRARLLAQTENIALFAAGEIDVVRVGAAALREEAWWRYGQELARRQLRARELRLRGKVASAVAMGLLLGLPLPLPGSGDRGVRRAQRRHFGRFALRGETRCPRCGRPPGGVRFDELGRLVLVPAGTSGDAAFALALRCPRCGDDDAEAGARIEGVAAVHTLRRVLAFHNFAGASEAQVADAAALIERAGSAAGFVGSIASERLPLTYQTREQMLALEVAVNEETERRLLAMELAELEARWREEEVIAGIADREL